MPSLCMASALLTPAALTLIPKIDRSVQRAAVPPPISPWLRHYTGPLPLKADRSAERAALHPYLFLFLVGIATTCTPYPPKQLVRPGSRTSSNFSGLALPTHNAYTKNRSISKESRTSYILFGWFCHYKHPLPQKTCRSAQQAALPPFLFGSVSLYTLATSACHCMTHSPPLPDRTRGTIHCTAACFIHTLSTSV